MPLLQRCPKNYGATIPSHFEGVGFPHSLFSKAFAHATFLLALTLATVCWADVSLHDLETAMQRSFASLLQLVA
jgi:hypothetical protein